MNFILHKGNLYLAEENWEATIDDGTLQLGPALISDPEGILNQLGCPTIQDIDSATWKIVPGDFQVRRDPWRPKKGRINELEGIFKKEKQAWRIILRGTKEYKVVQAYPIPKTIAY